MFKIIAVIWLACGILAAGFMNKSWQSDSYVWSTYDKCDEMSRIGQAFSIVWGIPGGPASLGLSLILSGFGYKGWSLERKNCKSLYNK